MVKAARASEISPPGAVKAYPAPKAFKAKLKSSLAALECICIDEVPGGCGFMGTEVNLCGRTRAFSCTDVTCMWSTSDWDIPSSTSCECSAPQNKTKQTQKTPARLSLHYLIQRGRCSFKYRRGCLPLSPIHEDLRATVDVYNRQKDQYVLSNSEMTGVQSVCMKNKWP